jgi:hypothetical protein
MMIGSLVLVVNTASLAESTGQTAVRPRAATVRTAQN